MASDEIANATGAVDIEATPGAPLTLVVMGVAGSGKSTVGRLLAAGLGWPFVDGDALHSTTAIDRMRHGQPLDDADRQPWLDAIAAQLDTWRERGESGVLACSALKRRYRDRLAEHGPLRFVYLQGDEALIRQRLQQRLDHFMPESLLDSQLADLEPPAADEPAIRLAVDQPPELLVGAIRAMLGL